LAPWRTLKTADAPECRAETGGFRATIVTRRPWVRIAGDAENGEEAPMFARVRWTVQRVCLEALELRVGDVAARVTVRSKGRGEREGSSTEEAPVEAWVVATFTGTPAASRIGVVPGIEVRQSLTCSM